jgi:hypothetical protein
VPVDDTDDTGTGVTHDEATPLTSNTLNSTSPLENWNFTALSKPTDDTVILFDPSANVVEGPKKELPFAVVLKTLTLAPAAGNDVTFIVNV